MTIRFSCLGYAALAALLLAGCSKNESIRPASDSSRDEAPAASASSDEPSSSGLPTSKELNEAADNLKKAAPIIGAEMGDAMKAMGKVMSQSENVKITAVDFRTLKEMLPEAMAGLKRTSREGQKQMGMSEATAEYASEDGARSLSVKISDTGSMRGMLAGAAAYAMSLDMDKETDTGYERNSTFDGFKAHEKMEGDSGEMTVMVGDRFLVEVRGNGITGETLKTAMGAIPLKKLDGLKNEGVEKAAPAANNK
ncbi:MAG: hypothetical protein R6X19_01955 [Kiritimatiellia bacterium]